MPLRAAAREEAFIDYARERFGAHASYARYVICRAASVDESARAASKRWPF